MRCGGRWTLGLALAFLSSFALALLGGIPFLVTTAFPSDFASVLAWYINPVTSVVVFGLALAAGFVLSRWWALPAL